MTPDRTRGRVPFPHFGGEEYLRFRTGDLTQLRQKYGENYREVILTGLSKLDPLVFIDCIRHGLKFLTEDGEEKVKRLLTPQEEDYPFHLQTVQMDIANALTLAWVGRTYQELEAERQALIEQSLGSLDGEPAGPPATSSSGSTPQALEQASTLEQSTD